MVGMSLEDLDYITSIFPFIKFEIGNSIVQYMNMKNAVPYRRHFGWLPDVKIWSTENMFHQLYALEPSLEKVMSERSMNIMAAKDPTKAGIETAELFVGFLRADVPQMNFYKLAGKLAVWDGYQG